MIKLLMNVRTNEKRIAVLEQETLVELMIEQRSRELFVGDIIKGRVIKVVPGLQAAFVDIGIEKTGYLHKNDLQISDDEKEKRNISELITQGSEIIVQIVKESFGTKGPKLTTEISLPGNKVVYLPNNKHIGVSKKIEETERERLRLLGEKFVSANEGLILRTSAKDMSENDLVVEISILRKKWLTILEQTKNNLCPNILYQESGIVERVIRDFGMNNDIDEIIVDERNAFLKVKKLAEEQYPAIVGKLHFYKAYQDLFSFYGIESEIEKALQTKVWMKNGAFLVIERTEAMTVIDVNTGKFTGKQNQMDTVLKTNKMAALEIAKQIRLRNLSGMIIIDFISMTNSNDLKEVENTLVEALKGDRNKVHPFGFTSLGLYQLTRKKMREPIDVELLMTCPCCGGQGKVYSDESVIFKIERELAQQQQSDIDAIWIETSKIVSEKLGNLINTWMEEYQLKIFVSISDHEHGYYAIRQIGDEISVRTRFLEQQNNHRND